MNAVKWRYAFFVAKTGLVYVSRATPCACSQLRFREGCDELVDILLLRIGGSVPPVGDACSHTEWFTP